MVEGEMIGATEGRDEAADWSLSKMSRSPLLITRFSLSPKTAIGVQTRRFFDRVEGARHLFWEEVDLGLREDRSICLQNRLLARLSPFKRPGLARRLSEATGINWWQGNRLAPRAAAQVSGLAGSTSSIYVAPIGGADAARMRHLVELIDRPFVLHLWDMLDGGPEANSDLAWLIERAARTYCLSREMNESIGTPDAPLLLFSRDPSPSRATAPEPGKAIRIAMIGDIASYSAGLAALKVCDTQLREAGHAVEWVYVGGSAILRGVPPDVKALLSIQGFLEENSERDRVLASCHFAFMPGPTAAPEDNPRSRYSIPSRLSDFMANGLPIVGVVHSGSAAAGFAARHQASMCCTDGATMAEAILQLLDREAWLAASQRSLDDFEELVGNKPLDRLDEALRDVAA